MQIMKYVGCAPKQIGKRLDTMMQASQHRCQYQVPVPILSSIFDLFVTQQHLFVTKSDTKTEILVFESASTKVKLLRPQYRANRVVLSNKLKT